MPNKSWFDKIDSNAICINNVSELKELLIKKYPTWHGLVIDRFNIIKNVVKARIIYPDGYKAWVFIDSLNSIVDSIRNGQYENNE